MLKIYTHMHPQKHTRNVNIFREHSTRHTSHLENAWRQAGPSTHSGALGAEDRGAAAGAERRALVEKDCSLV